jgi:hypothetical protein
MNDLAERLRQIERNPSPDLWNEITSRTVDYQTSQQRGLRHRVAAGLVAAVVSIGAFAFLVSVFRFDDNRRGPTLPNGPSQMTLLVSSSGPSFDEALLIGTLTSESGCVGVSRGPDHFVNVVWPAGYSLAEEGNEVWLIDDSGNHVAEFGDAVQMGGGITNLAHAEPSVQGGVPSSCEVSGPDAYWFAGTPELADGSSTPTPPVEEQFFVPPTSSRGSTTTLPLVFPDGSRANLTYPSDLRLAERGLAPNLLIHLKSGDHCGWDGIIGYNTLRDVVYEGDGPTFSVDGKSSRIEVWAGAKGFSPQYLAARMGSWELTAPCPRSPLIEEEASAWADTLTLTTTPEGYLVVTASPPLAIEGPDAGTSSYGPELYFLGGGDPSVEGATGILTVGIATRCPEGEGFRREAGWARGCFLTDGGALIMTIQTEGNRPAERDYLDAIVEGVEVSDITLAS